MCCCKMDENLIPIEIKSCSTYKPELLKGLKRMMELSPQMANAHLMYAGDAMEFSNGKHKLSLIAKNLLDEEYKQVRTPIEPQVL